MPVDNIKEFVQNLEEKVSLLNEYTETSALMQQFIFENDFEKLIEYLKKRQKCIERIDYIDNLISKTSKFNLSKHENVNVNENETVTNLKMQINNYICRMKEEDKLLCDTVHEWRIKFSKHLNNVNKMKSFVNAFAENRHDEGVYIDIKR